jgi:hypothetical protein
MDHWPERFREKCQMNKSHAVAQGLFDLHEDLAKGKRR